MPNWISRFSHPTHGEPVAEPAETEDWFDPRTDGEYEGGPAPYRYIRFSADGQVCISDRSHHGRDITNVSELLNGSYTGAGRFIVARQFQRPTVFVVSVATDESLRLRITDTTTQKTTDHTYIFSPTT